MEINWSRYMPFAKDAGERAIKTFAGGFIYGAGLLPAAAAALAGDVHVALSDINWTGGLDVGAGTTLFSVVFSLASMKLGRSGTASLTKAVEPADTTAGPGA